MLEVIKFEGLMVITQNLRWISMKIHTCKTKMIHWVWRIVLVIKGNNEEGIKEAGRSSDSPSRDRNTEWVWPRYEKSNADDVSLRRCRNRRRL